MIASYQYVKSLLPKPKFQAVINNSFGTNSDIINAIKQATPEAIAQSKALTQKNVFKGLNATQTAQNIHSFIRANLGYRRNTKGVQSIYLPSSYIYTSGDCKSKSLFIYSILANYYPNKVFYRFVNYNNQAVPRHVYVILKDGNKTISIDGTSKNFNQPVTPKFVQDMKIETISSNMNYDIAKPKGKLKALAKNVVKKVVAAPKQVVKKVAAKKPLKTAVKKIVAKKPIRAAIKKAAAKKPIRTAVKKVSKGVGKVAKKGFQKVKTVAGVAPRNSYLALVRLNFRGYATRLNSLSADKRKQLDNKWFEVGGNRTSLRKAIDAGKNKKPLLGTNQKVDINEPVTLVAALAAATPIILVMSKFIGKDNSTGSGFTNENETTGSNPEASNFENLSEAIRKVRGLNIKPRTANKVENKLTEMFTGNSANETADNVEKQKNNYVVPALIGVSLLALAASSN